LNGGQNYKRSKRFAVKNPVLTGKKLRKGVGDQRREDISREPYRVQLGKMGGIWEEPGGLGGFKGVWSEGSSQKIPTEVLIQDQ